MILAVLLFLFPVISAQAFSFCFSFGSKQRSNYYDYPPPYSAYRRPAVPGMSYLPAMINPYYDTWYPAPYPLPRAETPVEYPAGYE